MKKLTTLSMLLALTLSLSQLIFAQSTGKGGVFSIHNNSEGNTVIGFYTNDGNGWSSNWLSEDLAPDNSAQASFTDDTGACDQTLQVGWLGEGGEEILDDPIDIDICEASNVYLEDNEIYFD